MQIVAIGHQKRVGKDTCSHYLARVLICNRPKVKVIRYGFADKLKDIAYQLYGHHGVKPASYYESHPEMRNHIIPTLGKTPREVWIDVGMALRGVYNDTWIDYVLMNEQLQKYDYVLIPDLRFPNEMDAIISSNGLCIKVERPGLETPQDVADTALNDEFRWHSIIQNSGTLGDLYNKMEDFYREFLA